MVSSLPQRLGLLWGLILARPLPGAGPRTSQLLPCQVGAILPAPRIASQTK